MGLTHPDLPPVGHLDRQVCRRNRAFDLLYWLFWCVSSLPCHICNLLLTNCAIAAGVDGLALFNHADKASAVVNLGVAFHSCSIALNVLATSLIAGKLLYQRHLVRKISQSHGGPYLSLTAVFAESGAIYSITGLVYIPLYATSSPYIYPFAALLEAASVSISPLAISFSTHA